MTYENSVWISLFMSGEQICHMVELLERPSGSYSCKIPIFTRVLSLWSMIQKYLKF